MNDDLMYDESKLRYWRDHGKWKCAVPRPDPFGEILPERGKDWWKRYGFHGIGETKEEALNDWRSWAWAAKLVSDIY